jgi:hypothetical protein
MDRKIRVVKFLLCICKGLHVGSALAPEAGAPKSNEILEFAQPRRLRRMAGIVLMPTNFMDVILLMVECRCGFAPVGKYAQGCHSTAKIQFQFEEE